MNTEITDVFGIPEEHFGLSLRRPTLQHKGKYSIDLKKTARQSLEEWEVSDEEITKQIAATQALITAGSYSWGGDLCQSSLGCAEGKVRLLHIVAQDTRPNLRREEVERIYDEHQVELDLVIERMLQAHPNSKTPADRAGECPPVS